MTSPAVTVIIPAYRAAQTIRRAIDSVLSQTEAPAEVIVVDDGSPDETAIIVETYGGGRVQVRRKENGGAASARNAGLALARGEVIAFLDADDYWEPAKLARQLQVLSAHRTVGLCCSQYFEETPGHTRLDGPTFPSAVMDRPITHRGHHAVLQATRTWTSTVVVRRCVLQGDQFRIGLEPAEDRDMWVRLITRTEVFMDSRRLATAVLTSGSLSRSDIERDCRSMLRVIHSCRHLLTGYQLRGWRNYVFRRRMHLYRMSGDQRRAAYWCLRQLLHNPIEAPAWRAAASFVLSHLRSRGAGTQNGNHAFRFLNRRRPQVLQAEEAGTGYAGRHQDLLLPPIEPRLCRKERSEAERR